MNFKLSTKEKNNYFYNFKNDEVNNNMFRDVVREKIILCVWLDGWRVKMMESIGRMNSVKNEEDNNKD